MFKKLVCFTSWLLVLSLSLMLCFTLGLWLRWSTTSILMQWLLLLLLSTLLWCAIPAITGLIKGKKDYPWLKKYRLSRREYLLMSHWKHGANVIRRVRHQQKKLPWLLLMGERCGKSTLLAGAGLPLFDANGGHTTVGPTRTLRWWFFRQLCILDVSSQFLHGGASFHQAWKKLTHWCSRMPCPAGLIISLPVTALMDVAPCTLHSLMRQHRVMIAPLLRRFGERLPVYVIVTQCDHFPGFNLWSQQLSPQQRQQPLGYSWSVTPHFDGQDESALYPLFTTLKKGMAQVRLSMKLPETLSAQEQALLLDFPEAFSTLEPKLRYALTTLCEPSAYFSQIGLKGVWFCSAAPRAENGEGGTSTFIHDLLASHLHTLHKNQSAHYWYQRPWRKMISTGIPGVLTLWLIISASLSFSRLQPPLSHRSPDELAKFLSIDEHYSDTALLYFPFQSLLTTQQQKVENQLTSIPSTARSLQTTLTDFQQQILAARPEQQREGIIKLASAVLLWQQMRDGASLDELMQNAPVPPPLRQRQYLDGLSPQVLTVLERYFIRRPEGERWLDDARQLLNMLISHDPELRWLIASSPDLPELHSTIFWPQLPETISLPGAWTQAGYATINRWMELTERALGHPHPLFQQKKHHYLIQQQDAWRHFLIDVNNHLSTMTPAIIPHRQLLALDENQSPSMRFLARTLLELKDIPSGQAQPWLGTLRQLKQLEENRDSPEFIRRATQMDQHIRQSFITWLTGSSQESNTDYTPLLRQAWNQWQNSRSQAVKEALVTQRSSSWMTNGLFSPDQGITPPNPLTGLLPALSNLQEHLTPGNNDAGISAIWQFYQNDANTLLGNAIAEDACWLNEQWKSQVIWPLSKDSEERSHEELQTLSQVLTSEFLRGPAKAFLVSGNNGPAAAHYAGITVPLSDSFIHFIRQTFSPELMQDIQQRATTRNKDKQSAIQAKRADLSLKKKELEKQSLKIAVTSQPATIPDGARILPTGTQLLMSCIDGDQQLNSMNFKEKNEFIWYPGQCSSATIRVMFPDFTASYVLNGDDVWPWLVRQLAGGEMLLDSNDFTEGFTQLQEMGIKNILVRFTVTSAQALNETWLKWRSLNDQIQELGTQADILDERANTYHPHPVSALPDNITQCQSLSQESL